MIGFNSDVPGILESGFSTRVGRQMFSERAVLQMWLHVEAELASAQAEQKTIPSDAAKRIRQHASVDKLSMDDIRSETEKTGHTLLGLINTLRTAVGPYRDYVHYGATTQDIQDTAQVLLQKAALQEIRILLNKLAKFLCQFIYQTRSVLSAGRTHARYSTPVPYSSKFSVWLDQTNRNFDRIEYWEKNGCVIQMYGASGTSQIFGAQASELIDLLAKRLGIGVPDCCWHTSRDRTIDYLVILAQISSTCANIAEEIRTLNREEIKEVTLMLPDGVISSSTMPQKKNPDECEQIHVLNRLILGHVSVSLNSAMCDHQRDFRGTRTEWISVAQSTVFCLKTLEMCASILERCKVNMERVAQIYENNIHVLSTERLTFEIGQYIGKDEAEKIIAEVFEGCDENARDFFVRLESELQQRGVPLPSPASEISADPRDFPLFQSQTDRVMANYGEKDRRKSN